MRDRLMRGGLAGALGGLWVLAAHELSVSVLHFAKARWLDSLSSLFWAHRARNAPEVVIAILMELAALWVLGYLYAWIIHPNPAAGNHIGRAVTVGIAFWFLSASVGTSFRIPYYYYKTWQTAVTRLVAIIGWGVIVGWLMRRWDNARNGVRNE